MYKLTFEVFYVHDIKDEDGNDIKPSLDEWQVHYTQFTDMFSYPRVVSVERVEESGKD